LNFSYYIAKRYLFTKSKNNAINIISLIATIGVFAGALALFIVLSGFSGLKDFSLSFTNEFDPDLKLLPEQGKTIVVDSLLQEKISEIEGIVAYSKVIEERVFLDFREKNQMAFIKGVDERFKSVNAIDSSLFYGTWLSDKPSHVVLGNGISQSLSLGTYDYGSTLRLMVPKPGKGQITNPTDAFNAKQSVVSDIYSINEELDNKYVFSSLAFAQELLELDANEFSALEIKLSPTAKEDDVRASLNNLFDKPINIKNRIQLNDKLYKMLNTENLAVYLIFTLVLIIALFNVIGSIIMVILDKQDNIKTLYNVGASVSQIKKVFLLQGTLMTLLGGVLGLFVGVVIIYAQLQFNMVMITPSLPYPVSLTIKNILIVFVTIMSLGIIASYIASSRIHRALA
tara:strand:- start:46677 stop:47873 length:1197 start_codon:yes stop_codon:yes gene_type:complete